MNITHLLRHFSKEKKITVIFENKKSQKKNEYSIANEFYFLDHRHH